MSTEKYGGVKAGDRFGTLVVLERVSRKVAMAEGRAKAYWNVQCDCGRMSIVIDVSRLPSMEKSCRCLIKWPCMNLSGVRFGILTAVEPASGPPGGQGPFWSCKCDCGTVKVARAKDLRNGNTASCGCLKAGPGGRHRKPVIDINRPWRKEEHVDEGWLVLIGERCRPGVVA